MLKPSFGRLKSVFYVRGKEYPLFSLDKGRVTLYEPHRFCTTSTRVLIQRILRLLLLAPRSAGSENFCLVRFVSKHRFFGALLHRIKSRFYLNHTQQTQLSEFTEK